MYKTIKTKITSMHKGEYPIKTATPGGSLAIETELDPFLTKADSISGSIASTPDTLPEITTIIKIKYNLFEKILGTEKHEPISELKTPEMLMLSLNTTTTVGTVKKIDKKKNEAELSLKIPVVPLKGSSIGLARNINSHWRLIGFAEIT